MTAQTTQMPTNLASPLLTPTHVPVVTPPTITAECTECAGAITANVALPGEILDCGDCGAELEVRSVSPLVLAPAPQVEEDWGE